MDQFHHQRIDKGIPRGPRKALRRSPKADLGSWVIPSDLNPETVLERYLTESTTSQIASEYGLSRKALVKWLREVKPKEWKEIQLIRAHCRLDDGEDGIEGACDPLSLARAREQTKAAQFRLTALDSDYQPKQEVTHKQAPPVLSITIVHPADGEHMHVMSTVSTHQRDAAAIEGTSTVVSKT